MIPGRVSVIIPARNERFLQATIDSLLSNARGDIEILAVCDGYWPNPPLKNDPRVVVLQRGEAQGMRPAINGAAAIATGEYLLKCDAHCLFAEGYDEALKADCDEDWLVVPTRHSIDGERWAKDPSDPKILKPRDWNYHILTYPYLPSMYGAGFHGVTFAWDHNKAINAQRVDRPIDDILSAQGSCWFQHAAYFQRFPPMDHGALYFYQESQEAMLRVLAAGGRCVINKKTWYAHYHKGNNNLHTEDGRVGRGFYLDLKKKRTAEAVMADWCIHGWPASWWNATRSFVSMIEQHWWAIAQMKDPRYAWPEDWREFAKHRDAFEHRTPEQIPAHV